MAGGTFGPSPLARPAAPGGFEPVLRSEQLMEAAPVSVRAPDGESVCLVRIGSETHALRNRCTHQSFPLSEGTVTPDGSIECSWHGARFDCRTGAALRGPATGNVARYDVTVVDGWICVGPPLPQLRAAGAEEHDD